MQDVLLDLGQALRGEVIPLVLHQHLVCPDCGRVLSSPTCPACGTAGTGTGARRFHVRLPPRVMDDARLVVSGEGTPGAHGGRDGDLHLRVRLLQHTEFQHLGRDLRGPLLITASAARTGATVVMALPDGSQVPVRVPPGTGHGSLLRVPGLGLGPATARGDLYAQVRIRPDPAPPPRTGRGVAMLSDDIYGFAAHARAPIELPGPAPTSLPWTRRRRLAALLRLLLAAAVMTGLAVVGAAGWNDGQRRPTRLHVRPPAGASTPSSTGAHAAWRSSPRDLAGTSGPAPAPPRLPSRARSVRDVGPHGPRTPLAPRGWSLPESPDAPLAR